MKPEIYTVTKAGFILGDHYQEGDTLQMVPAQARSFLKSGHVNAGSLKRHASNGEPEKKPGSKKAD